MSTHRRRTERPWWRRRRNRPLVVLAGIGAVVILALLVEIATLLLAFAQLQSGTRELAAGQAALGTSADNWDGARIGAAEPHARAAARDVRAGDERISSDLLLRVMAALPEVGPSARAVRDLSAAARAGSDAFFDVLEVARVFSAARDAGASPAQRYMAVAAQAARPFGDADAHLRPAVDRLRGDRDAHLPGPLAAQVDRGLNALEPVDEQARLGAATGSYLPSALGMTGSRTYLLLLENPGELRPAGGFAGNVGTITFRDGVPVSVDIHPNGYYWPLMKDRFAIPYPLATYLGFYDNNFDIGDVAWDPDFPTTARLAEQMYKSATGRTVDGTIAIDPYAVAAFLDVTGPLDVPDYGRFSSADFFQKLQFIVNVRSGGGAEKDALGRIAPVILSRLLGVPMASWPKAAGIFGRQVAGRHIQLYMHDPALAAAAATAGADGRILGGAGDDYLLVTDANVGATKGDLYMRKSADLKTEVHPGGLVRHELRLTYDMPLPVDDADHVLNPGEGTYFDYLRVYLPSNASLAQLDVTLDGSPGGGSFDRITVEHGQVVVGISLRVPRGHRAVVTMYYEAAVPSGYDYRMLWQKQAGVGGLAVRVETSTPGGRSRTAFDLATDKRLQATW